MHFIGFILSLFLWISSVSALLPTYFDYNQDETKGLRALNSTKEITAEELKIWDQIVSDLIEKEHLKEEAARLYAYLYVAQRDVAYLSSNLKGTFRGSIAPISLAVVKLFAPQFNREQEVDEYTKQLSDVVFAKIQARFKEEETQIKSASKKHGEEYWVSSNPYGMKMGSWMPWIIPSVESLRAITPPSADSVEWEDQLNQVKDASKNLSEEQKQIVRFWAGEMPGKFFKKDDWLDIANTYMWARKTPLISALLIRSTLAMAIEDATIVAFDSKYTYWVKRPFMRDASVKSFIVAPDHPSYPAGHATLSTTAGTLLIYFFPDEEDLWTKLANEAAQSRIWAGIHFPIDNAAGKIIGQKVADRTIQKVERERGQLSGRF